LLGAISVTLRGERARWMRRANGLLNPSTISLARI
jgi:hypothetical protein